MQRLRPVAPPWRASAFTSLSATALACALVLLTSLATACTSNSGTGDGFYAEISTRVEDDARPPQWQIAPGSREATETRLRWWYEEGDHWRQEIEYLGPPLEAGTVTTVADGDELWTYDSRTDTYRKLPPIPEELRMFPTPAGFSTLIGPANASSVEELADWYRQTGTEVTLRDDEQSGIRVIEYRPVWRSGSAATATAPSRDDDRSAEPTGTATQARSGGSAAGTATPQSPPAGDVSGGVGRMWVDTNLMFVMRHEIDGGTDHQSASLEVTHLEHGIAIDPERLRFTPPDGAEEVEPPPSGCSSSGSAVGGAGFSAPGGFLRPSYAPDGFVEGSTGEQSGNDCEPVAAWSLLGRSDGAYLLLQQRVRVDIPEALRAGEPVDVGGLEGYRSSESGVERLAWQDGEIVALIESDALPFEELLRIAESAERVTAGTPPDQRTPVATVTPSASPPYALHIEQGGQLGAWPAVVLVDPHGGESVAWVLPEGSALATVSPDGGAVFWASFDSPTREERAALAAALLEEAKPHLSPEQRDRLRDDLDTLVAMGVQGDREWVQVASDLVLAIRPDLPRELAGALKDRLQEIGAPERGPARWHLLRTENGNDRVLEATSPPLGFDPAGGAFMASTAASDAGTSGPTIFDRDGTPVRELPSAPAAYGPVWSLDGKLAYATFTVGSGATPNRARLYVLADGAASPVPILEEPIPDHRPFSYAWSDDGNRLAVVTADRVRVFSVDGAVRWEVEGEFSGNPRWSPDGLLHVYGVSPSDLGAEDRLPYAYLFDADGTPILRVRWFGGCRGDPWLADGSGIRDSRYVVLTTGQLRDLGEDRAHDEVSPVDAGATLRWLDAADGGWLLARVVNGGFEPILTVPAEPGHYALERSWTMDGHYVFATAPGTMHACGEGWTAPLEAPSVERPPYRQ